MKFFCKVAALFFAFLSCVFAQQPTVDHLTPNHLPAGSGSSTMMVVGGNLGGSNVLWDGVPLTTTHITSTVVTAAVPSTKLNAIGTHSVTVSGGSSVNKVSFYVLTPLAIIDRYTPTNLATSGQDIPLIVYGAEFVPNATILFDWQAISTTFISSQQLQGTIPSSMVGGNVPHHIAVYNGAFPGGSVTKIQPRQFNVGTVSVSAPVLNTQNGGVIRDSQGTVTFATPWFTITGPDLASFSLTSSMCGDGEVMAPGSTCFFTVTCTPSTSGVKNATLTIFSDATNGPQTSALTCNASMAKTIAASPISLAFGSVATGAASSLTFNLFSTFGAFALSTPFNTASGSGDFAVTGGDCIDGGAVPCTVTVTFTPSSTGNKSGSLTINSGADNSVSVSLSGAGVTAVLHHVLLTWGASPAAGIAGYNVYRTIYGTAFPFPGTPLNGGTPVNALTYTDSSPTAGTTYIYGVKAVAAAGSSWAAGTESSMITSSPVTP